jgi:hypothetical protein
LLLRKRGAAKSKQAKSHPQRTRQLLMPRRRGAQLV